jgi:hypothetical protein
MSFEKNGLRCWALLLAFLAPAVPAFAATFYDAFIAPRGSAAPCYGRIYDKAHMAANPAQRLTSFALHLSALVPAPALNAEKFEVTFGFTLKGVDDHYQAEGVCYLSVEGVECEVEGDGGDFILTGDDRGLLLTVGGRLEVEGAHSFSPNLAQGGDDRLVRLFPQGQSACRFQ